MRLVLDIGNTRTKWGVFSSDGSLVEHGVVRSESELDALRARYGEPFVLQPGFAALRGVYPTLGADRIAAAVSVSARYPGQELLIVDFGTAITYDRVSADREFLGGAISPGMTMRFEALASVSALPLIEPVTGPLWARSTPESLSAGVVEGICFEVRGFMEAAGSEVKIIFTGGDAEFFAKRIKNAIFVPCQWVLEGLNLIANEK